MKLYALVLGLSLACTVEALAQQANYKTFPEPIGLELRTDKAPLFRSLADTVKAAYQVPKSEEVQVIAQATPQWVVVKRGGFPYYLHMRHLDGLEGQSVQELNDAMETPLPVDATTKRITLTEVVEVPGATKEQLYSRAYEWVARSYNSANAVVQMHDKESGKIIGKGVTRSFSRSGAELGMVQHTLSIYVKDGKYKYEITDLSHLTTPTLRVGSGGELENERPATYMLSHRQWTRIKKDSAGRLRAVVRNLKQNMAAKDSNDF